LIPEIRHIPIGTRLPERLGERGHRREWDRRCVRGGVGRRKHESGHVGQEAERKDVSHWNSVSLVEAEDTCTYREGTKGPIST
jgi:hypothetical protein